MAQLLLALLLLEPVQVEVGFVIDHRVCSPGQGISSSISPLSLQPRRTPDIPVLAASPAKSGQAHRSNRYAGLRDTYAFDTWLLCGLVQRLLRAHR